MARNTRKNVDRVTAVYEPAGEPGWWTVTIPEVPGCLSQGRGLAQARERIREALGLFRDDAESVEIVDDVRLPAVVKRAVVSYQKARDAAEAAQSKASERSREAVRALVEELGLSTRDSGAVLGVSQARVAQLAGESQAKRPSVIAELSDEQTEIFRKRYGTSGKTDTRSARPRAAVEQQRKGE